MLPRRTLPFLCMLLPAGIAAARELPAIENLPLRIGDVENSWEALDPLRLLGVLREYRDTPRGLRLHFPPRDWLRREHMPALLALARSTEPVAVTCSVVNAHAPPLDARSTLGREALLLVKAYRTGRLLQSCSNLATPPDPDEAERWWAEQQQPR